jgi:hypothetical protein
LAFRLLAVVGAASLDASLTTWTCFSLVSSDEVFVIITGLELNSLLAGSVLLLGWRNVILLLFI